MKRALILLVFLALALAQSKPIPVTALEFVPQVPFPAQTFSYQSETCDKAARFYPSGFRSGVYRPLEWRCYVSPTDIIDRATQQISLAAQLRLAGYELVEERTSGDSVLLQLWRGKNTLGLVFVGGKGLTIIAIRLEP